MVVGVVVYTLASEIAKASRPFEPRVAVRFSKLTVLIIDKPGVLPAVR